MKRQKKSDGEEDLKTIAYLSSSLFGLDYYCLPTLLFSVLSERMDGENLHRRAIKSKFFFYSERFIMVTTS